MKRTIAAVLVALMTILCIGGGYSESDALNDGIEAEEIILDQLPEPEQESEEDMAIGDKLVNLDDLKVAYDKQQEDVTELKSATDYIALGKTTISPTTGWGSYPFTIRKGWKYKFSATAGQTVFKGIYPDGTYTTDTIISFASSTTQDYIATDDLIGLRGYNNSSGAVVTIETAESIIGLKGRIDSNESEIEELSESIGKTNDNVNNLAVGKFNISPTTGWENYDCIIRRGWKYKFSATAGQTVFKGIYPNGSTTQDNIISFSSSTTQEYTATDDFIGLRGYNNASGAVVTIETDYCIEKLKEKTDSNAVEIASVESELISRIVESAKTANEDTKLAYEMFPADFYFTGKIQPLAMPDQTFESMGVNIYTDGRTYFTDYDIKKNKNTGGTTYYFSPNGNDNNNGLTEDKPKKSMRSMSGSIANGDTFILLDGLYKYDLMLQKIEKSINIIAKNPGKAIVSNASNDYVYQKVTGYTHVWSTERSNVRNVLFRIKGDNFAKLLIKSSIAEVEATPMSCAFISNIVYLNVGDYTPTNDNVFLNLALGNALVNVLSETQNVNLYLEGITFIGGEHGVVYFINSASYKYSKLYAKDCQFLNGYGSDYNSVMIGGCDSVFVNCRASYATRDGFGYHTENSQICHSVEINCEGSCNGFDDNHRNNNGSTTHDGGYVIRINGNYHDNNGPNVADSSSGSKSLNVRCMAYDTIPWIDDGTNSDFRCASEGVEMWLYSCKAFGSMYGLYNQSGSTMHLKNTTYERRAGGGTYDEMD